MPQKRVASSEHLLQLSQGNLWVAKYVVEFCTLARGSGWNELTLRAAFLHGLNEEILTEMGFLDENLTLNSLIDLTIRLDKLL